MHARSLVWCLVQQPRRRRSLAAVAEARQVANSRSLIGSNLYRHWEALENISFIDFWGRPSRFTFPSAAESFVNFAGRGCERWLDDPMTPSHEYSIWMLTVSCAEYSVWSHEAHRAVRSIQSGWLRSHAWVPLRQYFRSCQLAITVQVLPLIRIHFTRDAPTASQRCWYGASKNMRQQKFVTR
jgi:hypothetical protein